MIFRSSIVTSLSSSNRLLNQNQHQHMRAITKRSFGLHLYTNPFVDVHESCANSHFDETKTFKMECSLCVLKIDYIE